MSATSGETCGANVAELLASGRLLILLSTEGDCRVVWVTGELDAASSAQLVVAATAGDHPAMVIDLAGVNFMDCGGYGSLTTSRLSVEHDGRVLTTRGQVGQPARLFELIAALDDRRCSRGAAGTVRALPGLRVIPDG